MKEKLKSALGRGMATFGLHRVLVGRAAVVVCFHRVRPGPSSSSLTVTPEAFDEFCRFFADAFDVVPLADVVAALDEGRPRPHALAITFDDGYHDNLQYAAPILRRWRLPATFFVVTQWIGTDIVAWWDADDPVRHRWMTWEEVCELRAEGFEIGAHTRTHVDLGVVHGEAARREIFGSRDDLAAVLGTPPRLFAYPYGRPDNMSEENRVLVGAAGFRCCCSVFGGLNPPGTDPLCLFRVPISTEAYRPHTFTFDVALGRTLMAA